MANTQGQLAQLYGAVTQRVGATGGSAVLMAEGIISEISEVETNAKGTRKRTVTIVMMGGPREPLIIRAKLLDDLVSPGDSLQPYQRIIFAGLYRTWLIDGKVFPVVTLKELAPVTVPRSEGA